MAELWYTTVQGNESLHSRYESLYKSQNLSCGVMICKKNVADGAIKAGLAVCVGSFFLNMILFGAVIAKRSLMKQNAVYVYVASTLLANGVYALFTTCRVVAVYIIPNPSTAINSFTIFVQSVITVMFFVFYGNVCFLIMALKDNARFMARLSMPDFEPGAQQRLHLMDPKALRRKALFRVCLLWFIPVLTIVLNHALNCARLCACDLAHTAILVTYQSQIASRTIGEKTCLAKQGFGEAYQNHSGMEVKPNISSVREGFAYLSKMECSKRFQEQKVVVQTNACPIWCNCVNIWPPLRIASCIVLFILWMLATIFLFTMLWHSYVTWPRRTTGGSTRNKTDQELSSSLNENKNSNNVNGRQGSQRSRLINFPVDRKFWFLVGLGTIVFVCTCPIINLLFVDAIKHGEIFVTHGMIVIIFVLPVIYTFTSTMLLLQHIPSLRAAARGLFFCRWVG